jgi:hypothetical protein
MHCRRDVLTVSLSAFDPVSDIGQLLMLQQRSRFQPLSKHSFEPI